MAEVMMKQEVAVVEMHLDPDFAELNRPEVRRLCHSHEELRARLESIETVMKRIADYTENAGREDGGMLWAVWEMARAALGAAGQEQQHLVCSACGRFSDTEPRGGLCGMPRPPLGICCGRFRAALSTTGEKTSGRNKKGK